MWHTEGVVHIPQNMCWFRTDHENKVRRMSKVAERPNDNTTDQVYKQIPRLRMIVLFSPWPSSNASYRWTLAALHCSPYHRWRCYIPHSLPISVITIQSQPQPSSATSRVCVTSPQCQRRRAEFRAVRHPHPYKLGSCTVEKDEEEREE